MVKDLGKKIVYSRSCHNCVRQTSRWKCITFPPSQRTLIVLILHSSMTLITNKKPHHEASTDTLSRWICDVLKNTGIDICVFTAHSTWHPATSAAARNGLNIENIRRAALWTIRNQAHSLVFTIDHWQTLEVLDYQ